MILFRLPSDVDDDDVDDRTDDDDDDDAFRCKCRQFTFVSAFRFVLKGASADVNSSESRLPSRLEIFFPLSLTCFEAEIQF